MSRRWVQRTPFGASLARRVEDEERKTYNTGRPRSKDRAATAHLRVVTWSQSIPPVPTLDDIEWEFVSVQDGNAITWDDNEPNYVFVNEPGLYLFQFNASVDGPSLERRVTIWTDGDPDLAGGDSRVVGGGPASSVHPCSHLAFFPEGAFPNVRVTYHHAHSSNIQMSATMTVVKMGA